jgi:hypothetical protein
MSRAENFVAPTSDVRRVWQMSDQAAIENSLELGQAHEPLRAYYPITSAHDSWPPRGMAFDAEVRSAVKELSMLMIVASDAPAIIETYKIGPYYIQAKSLIRGIALWMPRLDSPLEQKEDLRQ